MLTHQADGALIVVTLGKTTYDLLDKALDTLRKARGRALGIVLNKAPLRGADASPYSYEYRREYASKATHGARGDRSRPRASTARSRPTSTWSWCTEPPPSGPAGTTGLTPTR